MTRIEIITTALNEMGVPSHLVEKMVAIFLREDITLEEKKGLIDFLVGR